MQDAQYYVRGMSNLSGHGMQVPPDSSPRYFLERLESFFKQAFSANKHYSLKIESHLLQFSRHIEKLKKFYNIKDEDKVCAKKSA